MLTRRLAEEKGKRRCLPSMTWITRLAIAQRWQIQCAAEVVLQSLRMGVHGTVTIVPRVTTSLETVITHVSVSISVPLSLPSRSVSLLVPFVRAVWSCINENMGVDNEKCYYLPQDRGDFFP